MVPNELKNDAKRGPKSVQKRVILIRDTFGKGVQKGVQNGTPFGTPSETPSGQGGVPNLQYLRPNGTPFGTPFGPILSSQGVQNGSKKGPRRVPKGSHLIEDTFGKGPRRVSDPLAKAWGPS